MPRESGPYPEHGAKRNAEQVETIHAYTAPYEVPNVGVCRFPAVVTSEPQSERWCGHCREWQPQRGILEVAGLLGCPGCEADWPDGPNREASS